MNKFWTVTDEGTTHTNSRSQRFNHLDNAIREATNRIEGGRSEGVYILEAVKLVRRKNYPVEVVDVN